MSEQPPYEDEQPWSSSRPDARDPQDIYHLLQELTFPAADVEEEETQNLARTSSVQELLARIAELSPDDPRRQVLVDQLNEVRRELQTKAPDEKPDEAVD